MNEEIGEIERLKKALFRDGENTFAVDVNEFYSLQTKVMNQQVNHSEVLSQLRSLGSIKFVIYAEKIPSNVDSIVREIGKDGVLFDVDGDRIERRIAKSLDDIIIHLLRNAIDHGIESKEVRTSLNKGRAHIALNYQHKSNLHFLTIEDNGGGIDVERVLEKAKEHCLDEQHQRKYDR